MHAYIYLVYYLFAIFAITRLLFSEACYSSHFLRLRMVGYVRTSAHYWYCKHKKPRRDKKVIHNKISRLGEGVEGTTGRVHDAAVPWQLLLRSVCSRFISVAIFRGIEASEAQRDAPLEDGILPENHPEVALLDDALLSRSLQHGLGQLAAYQGLLGIVGRVCVPVVHVSLDDVRAFLLSSRAEPLNPALSTVQQ